ncbi:hypothetical protein ABZP36_000987 [Zizania latifolia]
MEKAARECRASNGRLLPFVARAPALLAVILLSLASLRLALSPASAMGESDSGELYLPVRLAELSDRGYLRHGSRVVFLGDAGWWAPFLERHRVVVIGAGQLQEVADQSVDLVLLDGDGVELGLINRILKVGGVAAAFRTSESTTLHLPDHWVVVAHRSEAVAFAVEKTGAASTSAAMIAPVGPHRKLLAVPESKKDALAGLETVLLEPPQKQHRRIIRRLRPRFLPELTGDTLEGYRQRMFIDVTPSSAGGAASWFRKHYPRGKHEFEIVRLNAAAAAAEGIAEWLEGNVREEDYVVVKATAEAVEEILRNGCAVRRVDELFLDCDAAAAAAAGGESSEALPYWQCLALYGRLRDRGVAVHQWWGLNA